MGKLRLIVNAIPLTAVNTGIGRYLRCLYQAIEAKYGHEVDIRYFDGRQALPVMPDPPASVAGRSRLTKLLWSLPPAVGLKQGSAPVTAESNAVGTKT